MDVIAAFAYLGVLVFFLYLFIPRVLLGGKKLLAVSSRIHTGTTDLSR